MQATIILMAQCPVCGFRNQGVQVGTAQPRMTGMRLEAGAIGWVPPDCDECGHPLRPRQAITPFSLDLYDRYRLDAESAAKLNAWRDRQRARRATRKQGAA